ncbi:unnamed protein product, partial [Effrenium voratum]
SVSLRASPSDAPGYGNRVFEDLFGEDEDLQSELPPRVRKPEARSGRAVEDMEFDPAEWDDLEVDEEDELEEEELPGEEELMQTVEVSDDEVDEFLEEFNSQPMVHKEPDSVPLDPFGKDAAAELDTFQELRSGQRQMLYTRGLQHNQMVITLRDRLRMLSEHEPLGAFMELERLLLKSQVPLLGSQASLSLLKLLRVAKLVRTVRIMRTLRLFRGLRLLVHACFSFLPSLGWAMAMLGLCMICSGLAMGNLMQEYIVDETQDADSRLWIWMHYGTSYRAIYTMYEMTFAGNWPHYARPVLENVSQLYCIFYLLYITVIVFAVIRVISAIFVKETLEVASNDAEVIVQERIRQKAMYVSKLEAIFMAMDDSGDGLLSEAEMNEWLMNERVQAYLSSLDLDVAEGEALFRLLQNDDGEITYQDFIAGIMRCKGPARAIDQICLQTEVHHLSDALLQLLVALEDAAIIPHSDRRGKAFLTRSKHQMALLQATKNLGSEGSFGPMRSLRC